MIKEQKGGTGQHLSRGTPFNRKEDGHGDCDGEGAKEVNGGRKRQDQQYAVGDPRIRNQNLRHLQLCLLNKL